jgi:hypothetical protein
VTAHAAGPSPAGSGPHPTCGADSGAGASRR